MYFSAKEMLAQLEGTDKRICDLVIATEIELYNADRETIFSKLEERYQIMYNSAHDALEKEIRSLSGLTGGSAKKMWEYLQRGSMICDNTIIRGAAYALSCLEVNASMGLIVAAPTAGACGILPGSLLTVAEKYDIPHQQVLEALATASGVGQLIVKKATVSGAEGGCQAECGSAASMAAAAITEMLGGTAAQAFDAAAIAMQNIMGLVCDPVAGLVEMPCAKRNASGVANALVSADLALSGIFSEIPFDEVVEAMYKVGKSLPSTLRETALGGIATTPTALAMKEKIYGKQDAASGCTGNCSSCSGCN